MQSLEWLYSLESLGSVLGLEKILKLLDKLGNPQKDLRCIHVAGTNGKGSVCAILSSILLKAGYKIGMYTSPHLKRFNERIKICNEEISDKDINRLIDKIKPYYNDQTFFEVTTALAFLYFKEQNIDILVLEVGLGGRLDATNVITPLLSIITNISLEHTSILGDTLEKIAYEKAGIIKKGYPIITLAKSKALKTIKKIAKENESKIEIPRYKGNNDCFSVDPYKRLKLTMKGSFQVMNAALAIKSIIILNKNGYDIQDMSIRQGLLNASWPGRFEFIENNVLVDCAHNPAGTETLHKEISKIKKDYEKIISVIGIMKDKDRQAMIDTISLFSDYIIFTKPKTERASLPEDLAKMTNTPSESINDVKKALKKAKKIANPDDLIIVTGSIYTVGEVAKI